MSDAQPSTNGSSGDGQAQQGGGQQEEVEPLDLGEVSRGAIMERVKPLVPLVAGAVALVLVLRLLRGRGSSSSSSASFSRSGARGEVEARLRF